MLSKFGWNFILDRKTGKPLVPTPEVKVPTMPNMPDVNAWPTQPIPQRENILDFPRMPNGQGRLCAKPAADVGRKRAERQAVQARVHVRPVRNGRVRRRALRERRVGPVRVQPDPALDRRVRVGTRTRAFAQVPKASQTLVPGVSGVGVLGRTSPTTTHTGTLTAFDVRTNKRIWHQVWDAPCISGSTNTASNLTFVGTTGGKTGRGSLQALNTATGALLWESPKMDAMATAPPMTYSVGGKQYVSILRGRTEPRRSDGRRLRAGSVRTWRLHLHLRIAVAERVPVVAAAGGRHQSLFPSACVLTDQC